MTWSLIARAMLQEPEAYIPRRRRAPPPTEFHVTNFLADITETHGKHESTLLEGMQRKLKKGSWPPTWSQELIDDMQPYYQYKLKKLGRNDG